MDSHKPHLHTFFNLQSFPPDEAVQVGQFTPNKKVDLRHEVAAENNKDIHCRMERVVKNFKPLFEGIGKYKGQPVPIQMREDVSPVIQPVRKIPLHYIYPLDNHITELLQQDVIEGPLIKEEPGTWMSNLVITDKAWDKGRPKKGRQKTHLN